MSSQNCPFCGASVLPNERFCTVCGKRQPPATAQTQNLTARLEHIERTTVAPVPDPSEPVPPTWRPAADPDATYVAPRTPPRYGGQVPGPYPVVGGVSIRPGYRGAPGATDRPFKINDRMYRGVPTGKRVGAWIIDAIVIYFLFYLTVDSIFVLFNVDLSVINDPRLNNIDALSEAELEEIFVALISLMQAMVMYWWAVGFMYFLIIEGATGATVGKLVLRMRTMTINGDRPGLRILLSAISKASLLILAFDLLLGNAARSAQNERGEPMPQTRLFQKLGRIMVVEQVGGVVPPAGALQ